MKYQIIIYIVLFISAYSICQPGFNQNYLVDDQMTRFVQILEVENDMYAVGERFDDSTGIWGILIAKFDTLGQLLDHQVYFDPDLSLPIITTRFRPMLHTSDNKLLIAGVMVPINRLFLLKVDLDLNLEFLRFYPENYGSYHIGNILEIDEYYYLCGTVQTFAFDDDLIIIKSSKLGDLIWEKTYGVSNKNDVNAMGGMLMSDTSFFFNGSSSTFPHPDDEDDYEGQNWIFEVDTSGQILWEWRSEINPDHGGIRNFQPLDDGGWIMVTYPRHQDAQNNVHTSGGIIQTDSAFNTIWFQEWGIPFTFYTAFNDLILTRDGNALVVGNIGEKIPVVLDTSSVLKGWIVKVDLDGNTVWEVRDTAYWDFGGDLPTSISWLTSCVELESGNVIAVGHSERRIFTPDLFEGWMIKITPDGCVDTLCNMSTAIEEAIEGEKNIRIYPNPASDFVNVFIRSEQIYDAEIRLLDMSGRMVSSFSQLNFGGTYLIPVYDLPGGMYVLQLVSKDGVLQVEKVVVAY